MSDAQALEALTQQGALQAELFVKESFELDNAWANGSLDDWLKDKIRREKLGNEQSSTTNPDLTGNPDGVS